MGGLNPFLCHMGKLLLLLLLAPAITSGQPQNGVTVSQFTYNGEVEDIQWLGPDKKQVVFITTNQEVYFSNDEGTTFRDLSSELCRLPKVKDCKVTKIVTSGNNWVFLQGSGENHFISENRGSTWKKTAPLPYSKDIVPHPDAGNLVLATALSPKCERNRPRSSSSSSELGEKYCFKALYLSEDSGNSWRMIQSHVISFDWLINAGKKNKDFRSSSAEINPKSLIVSAIQPAHRQRDQRFGYWTPWADLLISNDFFKTEKVVVPGGNRFLFTPKFIFVAQVRSALSHAGSTEINLMMSIDFGESFYSGKLPFTLAQKSYTVLDTSEDTVFMHVNHGSENSPYGHVYISDGLGARFSLSFRDNHRNKDGKCDFEKVLGLEGVYIANYVENVDNIEAFESTKSGSSLKPGKRSHNRVEPSIRTVISFDKGGEWSALRPPTVGSNGAPIQCSSSDCALHLHGQSEELFGPVYSATTSVGLIMGVGNVGARLLNDRDAVNTYLSRDGGQTWSEVRKGSHIYEFGDHGGLIVMADDAHDTTQLLYSWTQGKNWNTVEVSKTPIQVENVIIEPTSKSTRFLVYGRDASKMGTNRGIIVSVDFSSLHERVCSDADYEIWRPRLSDNSCLLGHIVEYTRRKQDSACFNPKEHETKLAITNCECTEQDYECDFGYMRKYNHGPCERDPSVPDSDLKLPTQCPPTGILTISNGYRLVAGDTCEGGAQLGPTTYPCHRGFLGVSHHGWLVLLLVLALIVGMGCVTAKTDNRSEFDRFATKHFGDGTPARGIIGNIKLIVNSIKDAFSWRKSGHGPAEYGYVPEEDDEYWGEDNGDEYDFDEEEDEHDEPELISATTVAEPLPYNTSGSSKFAAASIPKLDAPPSQDYENDLFGDGDEV
mmetsp:Transcript_11552/g.15062  ORF Transcript_11552/g.15062 Transcript_11552/m.15062 type:complete len:887 (+) Transcript_11552:98-2758(+)